VSPKQKKKSKKQQQQTTSNIVTDSSCIFDVGLLTAFMPFHSLFPFCSRLGSVKDLQMLPSWALMRKSEKPLTT
jgi:hypothetical protein